MVRDILHGLYCAFIPFKEYERWTNGKRCTGVVDVDNVLGEFHVFWSLLWPMMDIWKVDLDVLLLVFSVKVGFIKNSLHCLRRYNFGCWVNELDDSFFPPLLFAAENGLNMLGVVIEPWGDVSREVILIARKTIDEVLFKESESWMELVAADGVKFKHGEEDEWAMTAVL
jgi:hypothetical protein